MASLPMIARNLASIFLLRPDWYRAPQHHLGIAIGAMVATVVMGSVLLGASGFGVLGWLWTLSIAVCAWKFAKAFRAAQGPLDREALRDRALSVYARVVFADSVITALMLAGAIAHLPREAAWALTLYGTFAVVLQVEWVPVAQAPVAPDRAGRAPRARAADFVKFGPVIGSLGGLPIRAWLIDKDGAAFDYVGCTRDPRTYCASAGQIVLRTGQIYQARVRSLA